MKHLFFEGKKIIRLKIFPIFLLITILGISGLFIRNVIQQDEVPTKKVEAFSELASHVSLQNQGDMQVLQKAPLPETQAKLDIGITLSTQLNQLIQAIDDRKWKDELEMEISVYNTAFQYKEAEGSFRMSVPDMQQAIKLNRELLRVGLPKEDFDLSIQTAIFMKKVVSLILNPIGFILLLLAVGATMTKEFEDHNMKLIYTLPIARMKYITIKYFSVLIAGLIWLAVVFAGSYTLPTLFGNSEGNIYSYPLVTRDERFLQMGDYLIESVVYSLCFVAFSMALLIFIGYLSRHTTVAYLSVLLLFLGGWIVSNNGFNLLANPFTYQSVDVVILDTPDFYPAGSALLIGAAVLLLSFTLILNRKRGM